MGIQFTALAFLKLLLQEIEKIVLINIDSKVSDSAEYSLVSNLGGMVPAIIYAPIE